MCWIDLYTIVQAQQPLEDAVVEGSSSLLGSNRQIRPGHIANEERISREYQPGIIRTTGIRNGQGDMFWTMAGRVDHPQFHHPTPQLISILQGRVGLGYPCLFMDVNRGPGATRNLSVTGEMIGMQMGFDHGGDVHPFGCY